MHYKLYEREEFNMKFEYIKIKEGMYESLMNITILYSAKKTVKVKQLF